MADYADPKPLNDSEKPALPNDAEMNPSQAAVNEGEQETDAEQQNSDGTQAHHSGTGHPAPSESYTVHIPGPPTVACGHTKLDTEAKDAAEAKETLVTSENNDNPGPPVATSDHTKLDIQSCNPCEPAPIVQSQQPSPADGQDKQQIIRKESPGVAVSETGKKSDGHPAVHLHVHSPIIIIPAVPPQQRLEGPQNSDNLSSEISYEFM